MAVPAVQATELAAPDAQRLVRLVRQDCGSCHGLTLKGGLGSPLLPAGLADKPAESLVATILYGRPGTAMPPWKGLLTEQEAQWIVERLQAGFPQE
jgi:cytochrome c55X